MYKNICFLTALLFFSLALHGSEKPLGELKRSGVIEVVSDHYSVSFFPGHMFPFALKLADGTQLPQVRFLDRLVKDKKTYFLYKERFAETRIIKNTPEHLILEISGSFVYDDDHSAPGKTSAVYRYECRKSTPAITITAEISCGIKQNWNELVFCQPGWQKTPFDKFTDRNGKTTALYSGKKWAESFKFQNFAGLVCKNMVFGIKAPQVIIWNNAAKNYYTYISLPAVKNWNGETISLTSQMIIRRFNNK